MPGLETRLGFRHRHLGSFAFSHLVCMLPTQRDFHMTGLLELISFQFKTPPTHESFSLCRAHHQSYGQYVKTPAGDLYAMRASYDTLGRGLVTRSATSSSSMAQLTINLNLVVKDFGLGPTFVDGAVSSAKGDLGRVREAFRHYVCDSPGEARNENRFLCPYSSNILKSVDPDFRSDTSVLVPGCGLGRLAWEISDLGILSIELITYNTTANFRIS
jgi:hypothetical protein